MIAVKKACDCRTMELIPAGAPSFIAVNKSPNWPTPKSSPYEASKAQETFGFFTSRIAGKALSPNRRHARKRGGTPATPTLITVKLKPHNAAVRSAAPNASGEMLSVFVVFCMKLSIAKRES
jgi:hypothetical protein